MADNVNTVRSPIAQAYLEYLMALHPPLGARFSRVLSAGIAASKPGVPLDAGVQFFLRDYRVSDNFSHTSRRLERRDVNKFEYVLTMSFSQRDQILGRWPLRSDSPASETASINEGFREDIQEKVALLGSFGGKGEREVAMTETINQRHWFHVGTKRIYPGYDEPFRQIKAYIADFVLDLTGYDVNSQEMSGSLELDSRQASHDISEDEASSASFTSQHWPFDQERSGVEALKRQISRCESFSVLRILKWKPQTRTHMLGVYALIRSFHLYVQFLDLKFWRLSGHNPISSICTCRKGIW